MIVENRTLSDPFEPNPFQTDFICESLRFVCYSIHYWLFASLLKACCNNDDGSKKVVALLGKAFHDTHQAITDLAARTPSPSDIKLPCVMSNIKLVETSVDDDSSDSTSERKFSRSISGDETINGALQMLEPLFEQLSSKLSDKVLILLQKRLEAPTPTDV